MSYVDSREPNRLRKISTIKIYHEYKKCFAYARTQGWTLVDHTLCCFIEWLAVHKETERDANEFFVVWNFLTDWESNKVCATKIRKYFKLKKKKTRKFKPWLRYNGLREYRSSCHKNTPISSKHRTNKGLHYGSKHRAGPMYLGALGKILVLGLTFFNI